MSDNKTSAQYDSPLDSPVDYLSPEAVAPDFSYLSIRDLLEARDAFHVHLARKRNVIGTAVGRYLIRDGDPDRDNANIAFHVAAIAAEAEDGSDKGGANVSRKAPEARTFQNSVTRPWSWPCVLVFVRKWLSKENFFNQLENYIPPFLYMPDGRVIPTCVVETCPSEIPAAPSHVNSNGAGRFLCGGDALFTYSQVQERFGTAACLVTDGATTYVLTAGHIAGEPGTSVWSQDPFQNIGTSSEKQVKKLVFSEVYPGLPATRTYCFLDAGLVRIDNVRQWSSAVNGLGRLGDPIDISVDTLSLKHIGLPLRGFGAASGMITGRVLGLFFRYRTLAGYDYVADMLIGPHEGTTLPTHPGDSGTLYVFDAPRMVQDNALNIKIEQDVREKGWRPVAMQWGGQRFIAGAADAPGGVVYPFAMATNFSSILRQLDVELIREGDLGLPEYWGPIGHFTIGEKACSLISTSETLRKLMLANQKNIGFDDRIIASHDDSPNFVPLSDVPDMVWKRAAPRPGHPNDPPGGRGHKDNPTHSANLEYPREDKHPQIREAQMEPKAWAKIYADNGVTADFQHNDHTNDFYQSERGSVPFRVWQIFEALIKFVKDGDRNRFVCAAGILAHYVGDACQPLHGTIHYNDEGCHSPYESGMLSRHRGDVAHVVDVALNTRQASVQIPNASSAAKAIMDLMERVQEILPWKTIVDSYVNAGKPAKETDDNFDKMWSDLGSATGACMAEGALLLASLWQRAWELGKGDQEIADTTEIEYDDLRLCRQLKCLPLLARFVGSGLVCLPLGLMRWIKYYDGILCRC